MLLVSHLSYRSVTTVFSNLSTMCSPVIYMKHEAVPHITQMLASLKLLLMIFLSHVLIFVCRFVVFCVLLCRFLCVALLFLCVALSFLRVFVGFVSLFWWR